MIKVYSMKARHFLITVLALCGSFNSFAEPDLNPGIINAQAELAPVQKRADRFNAFGAVANFEWVPAGYQAGFFYDIYYYIPSSLRDRRDGPALIFMHGGGASTIDRAGSNNVVTKDYLPMVVAAAEKFQFIAVVPSTNGLNWGGHTEELITGLAKLMREHLFFDTDRLGLSGHSMGGMGITRNFMRMVNDFSFVNSISCGMDVAFQSESSLKKMYNIPYVHQIGIRDWEIFVSRTRTLESHVKDLEVKLQKLTQFRVEWSDSKHFYGPVQTEKLAELFKISRKTFQPNLYGHIYIENAKSTENNIQFVVSGSSRYLWLQSLGTLPDSFYFELVAKDNRIDLTFYKDAAGELILPKDKKFKAYLSSKVFDLTKNIVVFVEGTPVFTYVAKVPELRTPGLIQADDPATAYEDDFQFSF